MVRYKDTLWCDGCGIEVCWEPVEKNRLFFCCQNCLDGEKCECGVNEEDYQLEDQTITIDTQSTIH